MASSYYGHSFPRVFVVDEIKTSLGDKPITLAAGEVGVFDKYTFKSVNPGAGALFATGDLANDKQFFIAQGSYHTVDSLTANNLTDMYGGLTETVKTAGIKAKYVTGISKVLAADPVQEKWTIGWDGGASCSPTLECDNVYTIRVEAKGDYILKKHNRNFYKEYSVETECCEGCETCTNGTADAYKVFTNMAAQINNDPEMSGYANATVITDEFWVPDGYSMSVDVTLDGATDDEADVKAFYDGTENSAQVTVIDLGSNVYRVTYTGPIQDSDLTDSTLPAVGDNGGALTTDTVSAVSEFTWSRDLCATIPTDGEAGSTIVADLNDWITNQIGRTDLGTAVLVPGSEGAGAVVVKIPQNSTNTMTFDGEKWSAEPIYQDDTIVYPYAGDDYADPIDLNNVIVNVVFTTDCPCVTEDSFSGSVGLLITAAFVETPFGNCSFHPTDHYNLDGIRFEISLKDDAEYCDHNTWRVVKRQSFKQAKGTGESVLRKLITANGYRTSNERFEYDTRWREAENQDAVLFDVVTRGAKYDCLEIRHYIPWGERSMGMTGLNNDHAYCLQFYFPKGTLSGNNMDTFAASLAVEAGLTYETL